METLKTVGYFILAAFIVIVIFVGGGVVSAILVTLGVLLLGVAVIAFVAACIKEYCEPATTDPTRGTKERKPQERS
jgi:hypothetical protein